MPLPSVKTYGALQCHAKTKSTENQCLNPAAYGMKVCRYHGARRQGTISKGEAHPAYIHGQETLAAKAKRSAGAAELRRLEGLMHDLGMTTSKRMPGRKPKLTSPL
jgi:hypothetical protein